MFSEKMFEKTAASALLTMIYSLKAYVCLDLRKLVLN